MRASIAGQQSWRMAEDRPMVPHCGQCRLSIRLAIGEHVLVSNEAAFHLAQYQVPPKLDLGASFVAGNHAAVRLKQTHHFVGRGNLAPFEHPRARLRDDAADQRKNVCSLRRQSARQGGWSRLLPANAGERLVDALSLPHHLAGGGQHLLLDRLLVLGQGFSLVAQQSMHLPQPVPHRADAAAKDLPHPA
jgi:hypothetical protein